MRSPRSVSASLFDRARTPHLGCDRPTDQIIKRKICHWMIWKGLEFLKFLFASEAGLQRGEGAMWSTIAALIWIRKAQKLWVWMWCVKLLPSKVAYLLSWWFPASCCKITPSTRTHITTSRIADGSHKTSHPKSGPTANWWSFTRYITLVYKICRWCS